MASYTFTHHSADPILGIRVGCDACRRANGQGHSPRGAIMRLAKDLAEYGAERTRLEDGTYRHARRTAVVKGNGARVKPRITLENVLAAESWYATHKRVPSQADLRTIIGGAETAEDQDLLRDALTIAKRDASPEGERVRAEQDRAQRRERERARRIAAKGRRK